MTGLVAAVPDERAVGVLQVAVGGHHLPRGRGAVRGRERGDQPAGGLHRAEQRVGHRVAALLPRQPAQTTASTSSSHGISTGVAELTTTTVRGAWAATELTSASCSPGSAIVVLSAASVSCSSVSPTTTTATSQPSAACTASASTSATGRAAGRATSANLPKPVAGMAISASISTSPCSDGGRPRRRAQQRLAGVGAGEPEVDLVRLVPDPHGPAAHAEDARPRPGPSTPTRGRSAPRAWAARAGRRRSRR